MIVYLIFAVLCAAYNGFYCIYNAKNGSVRAALGAGLLSAATVAVCTWFYISVKY